MSELEKWTYNAAKKTVAGSSNTFTNCIARATRKLETEGVKPPFRLVLDYVELPSPNKMGGLFAQFQVISAKKVARVWGSK